MKYASWIETFFEFRKALWMEFSGGHTSAGLDSLRCVDVAIMLDGNYTVGGMPLATEELRPAPRPPLASAALLQSWLKGFLKKVPARTVFTRL